MSYIYIDMACFAIVCGPWLSISLTTLTACQAPSDQTWQRPPFRITTRHPLTCTITPNPGVAALPPTYAHAASLPSPAAAPTTSHHGSPALPPPGSVNMAASTCQPSGASRSPQPHHSHAPPTLHPLRPQPPVAPPDPPPLSLPVPAAGAPPNVGYFLSRRGSRQQCVWLTTARCALILRVISLDASGLERTAYQPYWWSALLTQCCSVTRSRGW